MALRYVKLGWLDQDPAQPILMFSEIDDDRWEIRKVEVFRDGYLGYADKHSSTSSTGLGLEPLAPLEIFAQAKDFSPSEITQQEFEEVWNLAKSGGRFPPS
jgi:hypothetical protein